MKTFVLLAGLLALATSADPRIRVVRRGSSASSLLVVSDTFNRANEAPLAGNWTTTFGVINLTSNAAAPSGAAEKQARWNADTFADNQYAAATAGAVAGYWGAAVRVTLSASTLTSYACAADGADLYLYLYNAGGQSILSTTAYTPSAGHVIKLTAVGTSLTCYVNGVSTLTATNSTLTSGAAGIWFYATGGTIDAWEGGNL